MLAVSSLLARAGATALGRLALAGRGSMQPFPFPDGRTPDGEPLFEVEDAYRNLVADGVME